VELLAELAQKKQAKASTRNERAAIPVIDESPKAQRLITPSASEGVNRLN